MARPASETSSVSVRRGIDDGMLAEEFCGNTGSPARCGANNAKQPAAREGRAGLRGMAERLVVPTKPGNAGGGKGPWFKGNTGRSKGKEIGVSLTTPEKMSGSFRRCCMPKRRARAGQHRQPLVCESMNSLNESRMRYVAMEVMWYRGSKTLHSLGFSPFQHHIIFRVRPFSGSSSVLSGRLDACPVAAKELHSRPKPWLSFSNRFPRRCGWFAETHVRARFEWC